jgi:predicted acetyltransferase
MTPEIRPIRDDELPAFLEVQNRAFLEHEDVSATASAIRPLWDFSRTLAAFDDGRMCGTFRSWASELTVPGGAQLPAAAIAGVTVLPTHRRRGILRGMVAAEHAGIRERGEAVGMLYSAEYPIYGRVGYGTACQVATWTLDTRATTFHREPSGSVEIVAPDAAAAATMRDVFEARRRLQPGEIRQRRESRWEEDLGLRETPWATPWKGFIAVHRDATDVVDGYARYSAEDKWEQRQPRLALTVDELHALTDDAYAAVWRFLAEIDLVATVRAGRRHPRERLPWLLRNARAAVVSEVGDGMWIWLCDVARSLEARAYEREGRLVLEVVDPAAVGGRTHLALDAGPAGATCRPTTESPDLTLPVAALGAAYLGGTDLRDAVLASGGADEHRTGALDQARRLFRSLEEPWGSTFF